MTKRNPDIEGVPTVVSFVADSESITKFKQMVGDQNFSREIRAMIKDRVKLEKNEQAHSIIDPLNLYNISQQESHTLLHPTERCNNTRQSTLFEVFGTKDRRDEISKFVNSLQDKQTLDRLVTNASCMLGVAKMRRQKVVALKV